MPQGTRRSRVAIIGINSDEGKQAAYRGIEVTLSETDRTRLFYSGDPVRDSKEVIDYAQQLRVSGVCCSSSYYQFVIGGNKYSCIRDLDGWPMIIARRRHDHNCRVCGQVVIGLFYKEICICKKCLLEMTAMLGEDKLYAIEAPA